MAKRTCTTAQHCCSLHGWLVCIYRTSGDYAVVIHADKECSALIPDHIQQVADLRTRFFCTNLNEAELIAGKSTDKLKKCLEQIIQERRPGSILVLTSCSTLLVNENVEPLLSSLQKKHGIRIIYKKTSGFSFYEPKQIIDDCGMFLTEISGPPGTRNKKGTFINLIGFDSQGYYPRGFSSLKKELLRSTGVRVNAVIGPFEPWSIWRKLKGHSATYTIDRSYYAGLNQKMLTTYGAPTYDVPYPVGLQATVTFIRTIARNSGVPLKKVEEKLAAKVTAGQRTIKRAREQFKGWPLYYNIASSMDFSIINSAQEGMVYLPFFRELGFSITLLIQGNPERKNEFKAMLKEREVREPFIIFGHCGDAYKYLPDNKKALVFGSDMLKKQVQENGHYFLDYYQLILGFDGIEPNIKKIKATTGVR
jgi:nitrogenase molybdenum-iron protein alpha/beta subunit